MKKIPIDPKAKALIFDLDGTIVDTMPVHFKAYQKILSEFGIEFQHDKFKTMAGIPAKETMEILFEENKVDADAEKAAIRKEKEYETSMDSLKPIENVFELVKKYHGNIPISVGTGGCKKLSWKALDVIGASEYIKILVSNEDVENFKPDPETFLKCAELMGVEPKDCLVLEDSQLGIKAAKTAGMMWVNILDYQ